jgi:RimJ/RimL family protein N-acetyltransferase
VTGGQPNPIIRGEQVWLRPLERGDIEATLQAANDREISNLVGFSGPMSQAMSERWFDDEVVKNHGRRELYFAVCELGSSDPIGQCGLHDVVSGVRAEAGIVPLPGRVGRVTARTR